MADVRILRVFPDDINAHWVEVIDAVFEQTPWLGRTDAVAMHRRRAAMGDAPAGATTPGPATTPQGELGRLLQADARLSGVAPLATEWAIVNDQGEVPTVHFSDDVEPQPLRCRIDRADEVILDEARRQAAIDAGLIGEEGPERLVILRDVKSVIGPRRGKEQERHLRALYDEVQLAAYALAWKPPAPTTASLASASRPWVQRPGTTSSWTPHGAKSSKGWNSDR